MTKENGNKKRTLSKREKTKNPNLKKDLNIKARRDYIDTFYIDGVKNKKGKYVIPPLNEEEKQWLDKFYAEHVGASFAEESNNNLHEIKSKEERLKIKKKVKILTDERKSLQKDINDLTIKMNELEDKKPEIKAKIVELDKKIDQLHESNQKKLCEDANNARNRCLYNQMKKTGKLIKLNYKDYDDHTVKQLDGYDLEHVIIHDRDTDLD